LKINPSYELLSNPYDGKGIGDKIGDAIREIEGEAGWTTDGLFTTVTGVFDGVQRTANKVATATTGSDPYSRARFKTSRVVPVASEIRPASISSLVCISY